MLPERNADGKPIVELTEEQRYQLDTKGWLLIPGVLTEEEIAEMREFCYRLKEDPQSLPPAHRNSIGGPLERLTDHPVLVGFMHAFVAHEALASADGYGFRLEGSFLTIRKQGFDNYRPHGGSGFFNFPGNSHKYSCYPGHAHSGLTRAVWELNPVRKGDGGTVFLSGSHKAAFPAPQSILEDRHSPFWEDYECPAGSVLFFTEAITHSGTDWRNPDVDRVSLFNCYNTINEKWHDWEPNPEQFAAMPPLRQSLFRGVYAQHNAVNKPYG